MLCDDTNTGVREKVSLNQVAYCAETLANLLYLIEHNRDLPEMVLQLTGLAKESVSRLENFVRQSFE